MADPHTKSTNQWFNDYCQQHQLPSSSFYAFKKKRDLTSNNFVRAKVIQQIGFLEELPSITLTVGKANVSFPATTPLHTWLKYCVS
jgi:putative transposase